jgi:RNA polymerase sigma-70 factor (ECF subfamily)
MADDTSINLLTRWRDGDQEAAGELFRRYAERLIALAHRRLSDRMALRIQPEDVVQSVYCSFFVGARDGRYVLQRSGDLWKLLVAITVHKLQRQFKRHNAQKRAVQKERRLEVGDSVDGLPVQVLGRDPLPEEAVTLTDTLEQVMRKLEPLQRRIVELRLQGYGVGEIADEISRCRPTVRRVLDRVKKMLAQQYIEPSANLDRKGDS